MAMFAMNMYDGRLSVYVPGVTNCCYEPIPDDVAKMLKDKKIKWEVVANAINEKRHMTNFDWNNLTKQLDELNVRKGEFDFETVDEPTGENDADGQNNKGSDSLISLSDISAAGADESGAKGSEVGPKGKKSGGGPKGEAGAKKEILLKI